MKANKALKRLSKIEVLMSDVAKRYSGGAPHLQDLIEELKSALGRVKNAVTTQAASLVAKKKNTESAPVRKKSVAPMAAAKTPAVKTATAKAPKKRAPAKKSARKAAAKTPTKASTPSRHMAQAAAQDTMAAAADGA